MSAQPARRPAASRALAGSAAAAQWAQIRAAAPQVAATMQRYLQRLRVFLAPASSMPPTTRCASWPAG